MPQGKQVRIVIGVEGGCAIDALNFPDASCLKFTHEITAALGGQIAHAQTKPEARIRERRTHGEREAAR